MIKVEATPQNIHEVLSVAAVLVCKGYAQGTRRAIYLAKHEIWPKEEYNTYELFLQTVKIIHESGFMCDSGLIFNGGFAGGAGPRFWLRDESKELLLMSLIWTATYIEAENFGDRGQAFINVTRCNPDERWAAEDCTGTLLPKSN